MNLTDLAAVPAHLHAAADALGELPDSQNLPRLCDIRLKWDTSKSVLTISAQLGATGDDGQIIANLNRWAAALGSRLHLGEECRTTAEYGYYWRELSTSTTLSDGTVFEVWDHLSYPVPATEPAADSAAGLVAA